MSRTELFRFKILNRLSGYRLEINLITGCWIKANNQSNHYSKVRFEGEPIVLHFLACILFHNLDLDIPNLYPLHKCDIKACCNPAHLYVGTASENIKDDIFRRKNHIPDGVVHSRRVDPKSNTKYNLEFMSTDIKIVN